VNKATSPPQAMYNKPYKNLSTPKAT